MPPPAALLGPPLGLRRRLGKDRLPSGSQVGDSSVVGRRGDGSVSIDGSQKLLKALEGSAQKAEGFEFLDDCVRERQLRWWEEGIPRSTGHLLKTFAGGWLLGLLLFWLWWSVVVQDWLRLRYLLNHCVFEWEYIFPREA